MKQGNLFPLHGNELHLAAHLFVPERLTLAREWKGLTKADLAERVDKTASAISQLESGKIGPDPETVGRLAMALGISVSFFSRKMTAPALASEACHYRRLRSASQKDRKQLQARGSLLVDMISILRTEVEWQPETISRLACSPKTDDEIEELAKRVRAEWGLGMGPLSHVIRLLENHGVIVSEIPSENADVDAFSAWHEHLPFIFLVTQKGLASRTRFDAAHELGHLFMHADVVPGDRSVEAQADRFASAFLVPRDVFVNECPRTFKFEAFLELKKRWKVSVAALVRRGYDLGCLSEASYRRAYVYLNYHGLRGNEGAEPEAEKPQLIRRSLEFAGEDLPTSELAKQVGVSVGDIQSLLADTPI